MKIIPHTSNLFLPRSSHFPPWKSAFALDALRRAWLVIYANKGTAGADGQTLDQFAQNLDANLRQLQDELLAETYRPQRVTQVLVPKASAGWRPLSLWTVRDKIAQRAVYNYLEPVLNPHFLPCAHGFRPGRGAHSAAQAISHARRLGAHWVLDADIKDCFGQMRNSTLQMQLARWRVPGPLRTLIGYWLYAKVWNAWAGSAATAGTSQGGVISPLLCNLYLHPFDLALSHREDLTLVRYADDFVILSRKKAAVVQAQDLAQEALASLGLMMHPQKTRITNFVAGFQFVGWFFFRHNAFELK
ncbi:MAG: hypothetical protein KC418_22210 [Anaerolineales bacterium]|nr:hypothetical protein [Anaerolineales bacterium]